MEIVLKEGVDSDPLHFDVLWRAIGWKPRGKKKWEEVFSKTSYMVTAWDSEKLVGCARLVEDGMMCMLYDVAVLPNYQKKGVGSALLKTLVEKVKDKNYASIGLWAWTENKANIPFYEKFGFKKTVSGMQLKKFMKPE